MPGAPVKSFQAACPTPGAHSTSRAELSAREAELHNRDLLIEKLKHQLAGLRRHRFGAASEALNQLELSLEDEEVARAAEPVAGTPASAPKA